MLYFQIAIQRQKAAFPPNFVHSLDSSHMMMTAIACKEAGLHFAGLFLIDLINCFVLQGTYIEQYHIMWHGITGQISWRTYENLEVSGSIILFFFRKRMGA